MFNADFIFEGYAFLLKLLFVVDFKDDLSEDDLSVDDLINVVGCYLLCHLFSDTFDCGSICVHCNSGVICVPMEITGSVIYSQVSCFAILSQRNAHCSDFMEPVLSSNSSHNGTRMYSNILLTAKLSQKYFHKAVQAHYTIPFVPWSMH